MNTYKTREDVADLEKWNLADIYQTEEDWEKDLQLVEKKIEELATFNSNIINGASLLAYLTLSEEVSFIYRKVYAYGMLLLDLDTRNTNAQSLIEKARYVGQKYSSATSFFMPYLLSLEESKLKAYIKEEEGLAYFEKDLFESFRYKKHVLSKEKEEILSELGEALGVPSNVFGMINNADITFGEVTNEDGEKVELTRGMYAKRIESEDREVRKEAYQAYYKPYIGLKNTIATTFSAAVKNNVKTAKLRNYPSALEKSLFGDQVPVSVYNNLIATTRKNLPYMDEYMQFRKKRLQLDELRAYDLSVPLVGEAAKEEISYEEAFQIMIEALKPLGEEYVSVLKSFKENRYLDVRETPGKRSGAYNLGLYGVHPYILLNHRDDLDSLFTLAHECGHGMHSYFSSKHQPQISAGYSIFVAEVASTVNEVLLIRHLLKKEKDPLKREHLLHHFIDSFKGTFFTQVMFSEFEKTVHEQAEKGLPLSLDFFNATYEELFKAYNGNDLVVEEQVKYGWARIPHFYRPFYVYKYATGFASAINIADKLLEGKAKDVENYLDFLKSGSSDYPLELLKKTGVDLTTPEPIDHALTIFHSLVKEVLEK
ncbi:oligoendopeptidase F [Niallia sp. FSL W8-0635]|uniref:oligoendopeptidase F n=1 Tax=Niallia sp. FSL W8-0635 TaxID=2975337 RepID=UPI0009CA05F9|nr:Oligoendopeptidase F, plasmid [Mycobacteroides abscessus subsp. abscessus]HEO8419057.1 oligoendopeptidase F [Yersinia enterocolitica]